MPLESWKYFSWRDLRGISDSRALADLIVIVSAGDCTTAVGFALILL